jgi:39S ribosomal protein L40, mitochondrial
MNNLIASRVVVNCLNAWSRSIFTTNVLLAEPPKKKKRIDPTLLRAKVERKLKKLEKSIRKLERIDKQLKPIVEYTLPPTVAREIELRTRNEDCSSIEKEYNNILKIWTIYKSRESKLEMKNLRKIQSAQEKALTELKALSPFLYEAAVSFDDSLLPFLDETIIRETPKLESYTPPDGNKLDISKEWKM